MTHVANAAQILVLLRAHLERAQRAAKGSAPTRTEPRRSSLERIQQMDSVRAMSAEDAARALIAALLTDAFGEGVANDARLHAVVDQVRRTIEDDESGRSMLDRAVRELLEN